MVPMLADGEPEVLKSDRLGGSYTVALGAEERSRGRSVLGGANRPQMLNLKLNAS